MKRKVKERVARLKQDSDRFSKRTLYSGDGHGEHADVRDKNNKRINERDNKARFVNADKRADYEIGLRKYGNINNNSRNLDGSDRWNTKDAILRHNRRHPDVKLESGIFSECNFIEFAY